MHAVADTFAVVLPVSAMHSYQFSLFYNLLAGEIARYGKVGLA